MAAWTYAMEAMTTVTASLIDRGLDDYMLETAMLKVYSTEPLWTIVNDAFQITEALPTSPIAPWSGCSGTHGSTRSVRAPMKF